MAGKQAHSIGMSWVKPAVNSTTRIMPVIGDLTTAVKNAAIPTWRMSRRAPADAAAPNHKDWKKADPIVLLTPAWAQKDRLAFRPHMKSVPARNLARRCRGVRRSSGFPKAPSVSADHRRPPHWEPTKP